MQSYLKTMWKMSLYRYVQSLFAFCCFIKSNAKIGKETVNKHHSYFIHNILSKNYKKYSTGMISTHENNELQTPEFENYFKRHLNNRIISNQTWQSTKHLKSQRASYHSNNNTLLCSSFKVKKAYLYKLPYLTLSTLKELRWQWRRYSQRRTRKEAQVS